MSKKTQEVITQEQIDILNSAYPVMENNSRPQLPKFGMLSKDIVEESKVNGKKVINVIQSAGTFYTERDMGEVNEEGKKVWTKEFIGEEVDIIVAFHRKQLRLFDKSLNKFFSSPLFDSKDQIVPLYLDKRVVARGNQETLQALYPMMTEKGKKSSKLKEETVLFVIYKEELFQFNLSQSSKWSFKDYGKKLNPSTVVTTLNSVEETNGSNTYRKVTFKNKRLLTPEEFELVRTVQGDLAEQVKSDAQFLLEQAQPNKADEDFKAIEAESKTKEDALDKFN